MKVYIVYRSGEDCGDKFSYNIAAFKTKESAEECIDNYLKLHRAISYMHGRAPHFNYRGASVDQIERELPLSTKHLRYKIYKERVEKERCQHKLELDAYISRAIRESNLPTYVKKNIVEMQHIYPSSNLTAGELNAQLFIEEMVLIDE